MLAQKDRKLYSKSGASQKIIELDEIERNPLYERGMGARRVRRSGTVEGAGSLVMG